MTTAALNAPQLGRLAIVEVSGGFVRRPVYLTNLGLREPKFAETAVVFNIEKLAAASEAGQG